MVLLIVVEGLRPMLDISNWSELVSVAWFIYKLSKIVSLGPTLYASCCGICLILFTPRRLVCCIVIRRYSPLALPIPDLGTVNSDGCLWDFPWNRPTECHELQALSNPNFCCLHTHLFFIPIFVAVVNYPICPAWSSNPSEKNHSFCCSNPDSKGKPQLLVAENYGKNKKHLSNRTKSQFFGLNQETTKTLIFPTLYPCFSTFLPHVPRFPPGFANPFPVDHGWASPRRQVDHEAPHALRGRGAPVPGHAAAQVVGVQVLRQKNDIGYWYIISIQDIILI